MTMFTRAPFICYHLSLIRKKKSIALVFLQQQCTTAISWGPWKYNKLIQVQASYCSKIVSMAVLEIARCWMTEHPRNLSFIRKKVLHLCSCSSSEWPQLRKVKVGLFPSGKQHCHFSIKPPYWNNKVAF